VDLAYLKTIRQEGGFDRFDKKRINKAKALRYAKLFGSEKLMSVIKNILK
jgi:hypothetical protein